MADTKKIWSDIRKASARNTTAQARGSSAKKPDGQAKKVRESWSGSRTEAQKTGDKDASEIDWLFGEDAYRHHQSYSGQANAGAAYNRAKSANTNIYDRNAGTAILESGSIPSLSEAYAQAGLAQRLLPEGGPYYLSPEGLQARDIIAKETANLSTPEQQMRYRASSGDATVLEEARNTIDQLKEEGAQEKNWWQKIFGGTTYSNQDEIDEGEEDYEEYVRLLKLAAMEELSGQIDINSINAIVQRQLNYPEKQFTVDLALVVGALTTGYGKDDPEFPKAVQRIETYTGENPRRIAERVGVHQLMDVVGAQYDANLAKIDAFIDGNSSAAGTEYAFTAEDYLGHARGQKRLEQQAEAQKQHELEMMGRMADIHTELVGADDYAANSRYIEGGDYVKSEYGMGIVDADFGSMFNDLVNAAGTSQFGQQILDLQSVPNGHSDLALAWADSVQYMTEEDKQDFFYVYNTQGIDAAEQFLNDISWKLNKQAQDAATSQRGDEVRESAGNAVLYSIGSIGEQFMANLAGASVGLSKLLGQDVHEYDSRFLWGKLAGVTRDTAGDMIEEATPGLEILGHNLGKTLYNGVMGAADTALNSAVFGYGATPMMASGTFGDAYRQNLAAMGDTPDALMDAVVDAGIEVATDYLGIDKLPGGSTHSGFKALLRKALTEPSQEVMNELLSVSYDLAKYGENTRLQTRISELVTMGYASENAEKIAVGEFFNDLFDTMLTAVVSGMAGGTDDAA